MGQNFTYTTLGNTGLQVHRLGLSTTYLPGKKTVYRALDGGMNYLFGFGIDTQMIHVMRDIMQHGRDRYVIATGAYNFIIGYPNLRRTLEKRLRQLRTDYIDLFMFLGVTEGKQLKDDVLEQFARFKEEGKIRATGISTHDRKFAGKMCAEGKLDTVMMRFSAAHQGAEQDIFPHLEVHNPGVISFTATRWRYLLRRPKGYPKDGRIPTAGECYRFVLSNPHVHVCMTAPMNVRQLEQNLAAVEQGPLSDEDMEFMRKFGDIVHYRGHYFMGGT
jgi:aryl-alcohol dehydrogenase-like predicted oxidoreductase